MEPISVYLLLPRAVCMCQFYSKSAGLSSQSGSWCSEKVRIESPFAARGKVLKAHKGFCTCSSLSTISCYFESQHAFFKIMLQCHRLYRCAGRMLAWEYKWQRLKGTWHINKPSRQVTFTTKWKEKPREGSVVVTNTGLPLRRRVDGSGKSTKLNAQ